MVLNFSGCLVKEKSNYCTKLLLAFLKQLLILKIIPKDSSEFLFRVSFCVMVCFLQCTVHVIASFRNNFKNHTCFQNNFLKSLTTTWKLEKASWRGLLEGFSELVSDFKEASRNLIFIFSTKGSQYCKTISADTKSINLMFKTLKKIFISRHYPLRKLFYTLSCISSDMRTWYHNFEFTFWQLCVEV